MPRMSIFNSPLLLGFDHFEQMLDRASKASAEGYPPYNIEQIGENSLRITLAVAGFSMDDLTVSLEDNQLVVRGHLEDKPAMGANGEETVFLHRGIASRQFQRSFVLAEGIEVHGANLDNGLLFINLERLVPEPEIRAIKIESGGPGNKDNSPKTIDVQPE
ncbi:MAG: Hsp20 family protein [Alphaproteobacteria bacterium]|jgi:HSP20 family molecular chaperone IbpA|nr:Hsp20 family protein [Alphaproteobacteria bacterium]